MSRKILLITDNSTYHPHSFRVDCDRFQAKVAGIGYDYLRATSQAQGFEMASRFHPSLIVLEHVQATPLDALELCRQLKASQLTAAIPILIYSGESHLDDFNRAYMLGASFYLCFNMPHKPSETLSELLDSCLRILDREATEHRRYHPKPQPFYGIKLSPVYN